MKMFSTDGREEIRLDVEPHPWPIKWPATRAELDGYARRLDPNDTARTPQGWQKNINAWKNRQHTLMMRLHIGFFETMGVDGWPRLHELIVLMHDDPGFVREMMRINGEFVAALIDRLLQDVQIDAAIFGEPIGDNHGSLISPKMYADLVLSSYQPILDVLKRQAVDVPILRTYANARQLIPVLLEHGLNCLWACEVNAEAMDYRLLRQEFGKSLRLIGGIDLDVLREGKDAIRREVEEKVPPLLEQGGYVPLADGRVRADIPFENYVYYRELLERVTKR
jgi:uroporphyrinogen decarboxylase